VMRLSEWWSFVVATDNASRPFTGEDGSPFQMKRGEYFTIRYFAVEQRPASVRGSNLVAGSQNCSFSVDIKRYGPVRSPDEA